MKVVENIDEAIGHIRRFSTKHSEVIVTNDYSHARQFAADWPPAQTTPRPTATFLCTALPDANARNAPDQRCRPTALCASFANLPITIDNIFIAGQGKIGAVSAILKKSVKENPIPIIH